jgi:2,4-dienoyl-CoA reductase-like NADH-dependent reductase (Old Yellow Enzyme family)
LIVTEGTYIPHRSAGPDPKVPHLYGEAALTGWRRVVEAVHGAGGKIFSQLWHVGKDPVGPEMPVADIESAIEAYAEAAANARTVGFDGVELHGAHGYLIDQFFWDGTNKRTDRYGGDLVQRTRFAVDAIRAVRKRVGVEFPVVLRFSQWKLQDFEAKLARTPEELASFLSPLVTAGIDAFHCSTRRFWEPEFAGSDLNLAGWTKKLSGKPTITVGSVTLNEEFMKSFRSEENATITGVEELQKRLEAGEFDLVAIGRSLIVNPAWAETVKRGAIDELLPFNRSVLAQLL